MLNDLDPSPTRPSGETGESAKVSATLEVLSGTPIADVAQAWHVEPTLLDRWVQSFVEAGTAQLLNRPTGDAAAQRDRFLAAFAHEIRTPLTVALGWMDVLAYEELSPATVEGLTRVEQSLEQLRDRSLDVELLATAVQGRLRTTRQMITVEELLIDSPGRCRLEAAAARTPLFVDRSSLLRLLNDLWGAATKHPAPERAWFEAVGDGPWIEIAAVRVGHPLEPAILRALLEPYAANDDATGITLGLYLARALAVAHEGTIGIDQDGERCRFWVRLPIHAALTTVDG